MHNNSLTDAILESALTAPATIIKAPPGAGKSYLAALIAGLNTLGANRSVAIATPTRAQGIDLAQNITTAYPAAHVTWHAPEPAHGLNHTPKVKDLPPGPHIAVGTIAKWGYYTPEKHDGGYDLLIVDEAWQVTDAALATIAHLAPRHVLIGDPGQIAPVVTADMSEWATLPDAPTRPAPETMTYRHPSTPVFQLPATRRFGPDTANVVSTHFYDFDWGTVAEPHTLVMPHHTGIDTHDVQITASTLQADHTVTRADPEMAGHLAKLAQTISTEGHIQTPYGSHPVGTIYIAAAHVDQVAAARAATAGMNVVVDTAERLQGRQTEVVLVWHPVSGQETATDFQRDTGRLCVMLSRHKAACIVAMREDTPAALNDYASAGRTVSGTDTGYQSWATAREVTATLTERTITRPAIR